MSGGFFTFLRGPAPQKRGRDEDVEPIVEPIVLARIRGDPLEQTDNQTALQE